jgi:hypothetical protein
MAFNYKVIFNGDAGPLKKAGKEAQSTIESLKGSLKTAAVYAAGTFGGIQISRELIDVTKRYQSLEAQLKTATGSLRGQQQAMAALKSFAKEYGQDLEGVTTAFVRLKNLGLDPSQESLKAYASIAAATGKTTIDFVEAVADASVAEFERLKEFGIRARNEGDQIAFTFQGTTTRVANNASEIEKYLADLGNSKFGAALEDQADTFGAALERANLSLEDFFYAISQAGAADAMTGVLESVTGALEELTALISSGQLQGTVMAWAQQFNHSAQVIADAIDFVNEYWLASIDTIEENGIDDAVMSGLQHLPAHLEALAQIFGVGLAALFDKTGESAETFGELLVVQMRKIGGQIGAIVNEVIDRIKFLDGDTFDYSAAMKKNTDQAKAETERLRAELEATHAQINSLTADLVGNIIKERDETIAANEEKIQSYRKLREEWEKNQQSLAATNLGDFKIPGADESGTGTGGAANDEDVTDAQVQRLREQMMTEQEALIWHHNEMQRINAEAYEQGKLSEEEYLRYKEQLLQDYTRKSEQLEAQQNMARLNNYEQLFGDMAGIVGTFAGEQTAVYKGLFAVSKGFSIAQSIIAIQNGIAQAISMGFPQNIPLIASTAAQGAKVLSTIRGTSFQGQAHDGISRVPAANEGTWLLKKNEMVLNPKQADNFDYLVDFARQGGKNAGSTVVNLYNTITVDARGAAEGTEAQVAQAMEMATDQMQARLHEDFSNGGPLYRQLQNRGMAA